MFPLTQASYPLSPHEPLTTASLHHPQTATHSIPQCLAEAITREASSQTYYTIRALVDRPLVAAAYRAYAYFRWVDDIVDEAAASITDRLAFLERQQAIINHCYEGQIPADLCREEQMVAELIQGDRGENGGLRLYITQMMAVMLFDAGRKGRLITQAELAKYTQALAMAVTEAMHYFIGHDAAAPYDETRYLAVSGAHITHMLRDAVEDAAAGYINIPQEVLEQHQFTPTDWTHEAFRAWVQQRVQLARHCFASGRQYLARLESLRCRLAGYAYIARFEVVLDLIEKDEYQLRLAYLERKSHKAALKMCLAALAQTGLSYVPRRHTPLPYPLSPTEVLR